MSDQDVEHLAEHIAVTNPDPQLWLNIPVRMVCFDWGGVILRICRSWAEGCAAAGLPVRGDSASPDLRVRRRIAAEEYQRGRFTTAEFLRSLESIVENVYSQVELKRIHDGFLIEEYAGVDRLVDRLANTANIETGMLSNTNELHWQRQHADSNASVPHFPTASRLNHRHASHLLGHAKPGHEIYRAFERHTGFRGPEVLFFDDLADNIAAARAVGWRAEQIDHTGDTAAQMHEHLQRHGVFAR